MNMEHESNLVWKDLQTLSWGKPENGGGDYKPSFVWHVNGDGKEPCHCQWTCLV